MSRRPTIDRRSGLTRDEFIYHYRDRLLPVILTDAMKDWSAPAKFTFEFFKEQLGDREVIIDSKKYKLGELIDVLLSSTREKPTRVSLQVEPARGVRRAGADVLAL